EVGTVSLGTTVGDGARGLQRERRCLELLHPRSRPLAGYRWGEDGIAGISDDKQHLCFALALWNGQDPILKERLFGLTNSEGNHGEDVKEYYFYLDSTPDPLVHKVSLQVPTGGLSLRGPHRDESDVPSRESWRASRYGIV